MIQFNLLPDVKLEYIRTERLKRLVISGSLIAGGVALVIFAFLLVTVDVLQKKNMKDLTADIKKNTAQLQGTTDLNKILTIQNQLGVLTSLHDAKPAAGRVFGYLSQLTPQDTSISSATFDFTANTATIQGQAPSLEAVNTFADGLKFTTYTVGSDKTDSKKAFSNVVLSQFGVSDDKGTTFTITVAFDHAIFGNGDTVTLTVPNIISTRSVVEQPSIFQKSSSSNTTKGQ